MKYYILANENRVNIFNDLASCIYHILKTSLALKHQSIIIIHTILYRVVVTYSLTGNDYDVYISTGEKLPLLKKRYNSSRDKL